MVTLPTGHTAESTLIQCHIANAISGLWFKRVFAYSNNNTESVINVTVHTNGIRKKAQRLI